MRAIVSASLFFTASWYSLSIRAFEIAAIDYFLKPVTEERFALAQAGHRQAARRVAGGYYIANPGDARCRRESPAAT